MNPVLDWIPSGLSSIRDIGVAAPLFNPHSSRVETGERPGPAHHARECANAALRRCLSKKYEKSQNVRDPCRAHAPCPAWVPGPLPDRRQRRPILASSARLSGRPAGTTGGVDLHFDKATSNSAMPLLRMPSTLAAASERSKSRPFRQGPRSLIRTTTDRPVAGSVNFTRLPSGRVRFAAVNFFRSNRSPDAVCLPWNLLPYQETLVKVFAVPATAEWDCGVTHELHT